MLDVHLRAAGASGDDRVRRPHERNRVQSFNDFLVFGSMAIGSFASGNILVWFGWAAVNEVVFPVVLAAGALLAWLTVRGNRAAA